MIAVQGYTVCDTSLEFMKHWITHIDCVPPKDRHLGYGQTSCWYAYEQMKYAFPGSVNWHSVDKKFVSPAMKEDDIIWSANTSAGKTVNLKKCKEDFNEHFSVR
jgi:hypothetical protein